ncbi:hypothetical protein ACIGEO_18460 [Stenotrophomonas bentonitica]|uniref:hypothetical protein n=1 Tax=Stenotrophomonas bentonitica TaxID=1450134 RepID=UPI0037D9560A
MKIRTSKIVLISPVGLALIAYAFFLACTLVPPSIYQGIMHENNYMFMHLPSHFLVGGCLATFLMGATLFGRKAPTPLNDRRTPGKMRASLIALPIICLSIVNLASIALLLENNPNLLMGWLSDGRSAKMDLDATGAMTNALPALYAVCWWGLWRLMDREYATGKREWTLRFTLAAAVLIAVYSALIKVARYDLLPCVFGLAVVFLTHRYSTGRLQLAKSLTSFLIIIATVAALFLLMAWLRGSEELAAIGRNVVGYTASSYNRLAALLDGDVTFPYSGTGVYSFKFLTYIPVLNRWVDFASLFGMPTKEEAWMSEFGAIAQSGLDGSYIWVSAFGYVYSDIGVFVAVYFFLIGLASRAAWRSVVSGRVAGLIIYPWIAFSILFWMGDNFLALSKLIVFIGTAALMVGYEKLARSRHQIA